MHYALAPEQKKFFEWHGAIVFDNLWDSEALEAVHAAMQAVLARRLDVSVDKIERYTSQQHYVVGRDLWRGDLAVKKLVTSLPLAELAAELFGRRPLRLAYDQYLPSWRAKPPSQRDVAELCSYAHLLERSATLEETSSIQGLVGGALICLQAPEIPLPPLAIPALVSDKAEANPSAAAQAASQSPFPPPEPKMVSWPGSVGNTLLFRGSVPFNFSALRQSTAGSYLLIAYCRDSSVYVLQPGDPQVHAFKHLGYAFGDRLTDKLNPIVVR